MDEKGERTSGSGGNAQTMAGLWQRYFYDREEDELKAELKNMRAAPAGT